MLITLFYITVVRAIVWFHKKFIEHKTGLKGNYVLIIWLLITCNLLSYNTDN